MLIRPTRPQPLIQSVNDITDMNYNPECESDYDSSDNNMVTSIASITFQTEPRKQHFLLETQTWASRLSVEVSVAF